MSTAQPPTSARSNSALVVIDVQNGVMQASWNSESVVSTIADLVDRARKTGTEVVWVRHSSGELPIDSPQWQIVDALSPADGESIIEKTHGNTFEDTDFEEVLAGKDVGHLVVTGAHTTEDLTEWGAPPPEQVVSHTNLYWQFESGPGRQARVQESSEVDFAKP